MNLKLLLKIILIMSLTLGLFVGCKTTDDSDTSSSSDQSAETSNGESETEIVKDYPYINGSFIQYGPFLNYTDEQLENHFNYLQQVGIEYLVLFTCAFQNADGSYNEVYYPSEIAAAKQGSGYNTSHTDIFERMLAQCQSHGMKAYISPNYSEEGWYNNNVTIGNWYKEFSTDSVAIAKELYSLYKDKYGDTLYGWYFVPEFTNYFVNFTDDHYNRAAEMLNIYIDGINELDPSMPFLMSPYFVEQYSDAKDTASKYDKVFAKINFRKGDIFCPQDCVGSGFLNAQTFVEYYKELKTVIDKYPNLAFWGNPESFKQTNWSTAPITRFVYQLETAAPYVDGFISFAYSHYYAPDVCGTSTFHDDYVKYYNTGEVTYYSDKEEITPISIESTATSTGVGLTATFENSKYGISYVEFYRETELVATAHTEMEDYSKESITYSITDKSVEANNEYKYSAIAYDFLLRPSEKQEITVDVKIPECISIGKKYASDYTGNNGYPDDGKRLTDGIYATSDSYSDKAASGFADVSSVSFVIDLGESTEISSVLARGLSSGSGGAIISSNVEISFSDDGITFNGAISVDATTYEIENGYSNVLIPVTGITARYVKVSYISLRNWLFIDEIAVYK